MLIKVDTRETALLQQINYLVETVTSFKFLTIKTETLPLGDIIINDDKEDKLIIERKSINDLMSSIKDGRYEEQSYRLNGLEHHNHNIIYLIEGDVNRVNKFKPISQGEKQTVYSAMFSLNYFKGFSVFRSFSMEETATIVCNMAYKMHRDAATKTPFYPNPFFKKMELNNRSKVISQMEETLPPDSKEPFPPPDSSPDSNETFPPKSPDFVLEAFLKVEKVDNYVTVIKKIKKDNITPDNIGEIMLCQIPGISSVTALAVMDKYKSLSNLMKELELNNESMKDLSYTNSKGQIRKISKTCIENIVKFLLKK
jgi:ERCC4-type nuclease